MWVGGSRSCSQKQSSDSIRSKNSNVCNAFLVYLVL